MTQVDDGIGGILTYGLTRTHFGTMLGDKVAGRGVLVLEYASVTNGGYYY